MSTKKQIISAKFPVKLKLARQQKGFTQGQLAQKLFYHSLKMLPMMRSCGNRLLKEWLIVV